MSVSILGDIIIRRSATTHVQDGEKHASPFL